MEGGANDHEGVPPDPLWDVVEEGEEEPGHDLSRVHHDAVQAGEAVAVGVKGSRKSQARSVDPAPEGEHQPGVDEEGGEEDHVTVAHELDGPDHPSPGGVCLPPSGGGGLGPGHWEDNEEGAGGHGADDEEGRDEDEPGLVRDLVALLELEVGEGVPDEP